MIPSIALAFVISVFVFITLTYVVRKERKNGQRFFATRFRVWLDEIADKVGSKILSSFDHFVKYIIQLHWYYSIHSVLKAILKTLVAFYTYIEGVFEKNRSRTKELRLEKQDFNKQNHLHQMAKHKTDTALTPGQKNKLRKKKLG